MSHNGRLSTSGSHCAQKQPIYARHRRPALVKAKSRHRFLRNHFVVISRPRPVSHSAKNSRAIADIRPHHFSLGARRRLANRHGSIGQRHRDYLNLKVLADRRSLREALLKRCNNQSETAASEIAKAAIRVNRPSCEGFSPADRREAAQVQDMSAPSQSELPPAQSCDPGRRRRGPYRPNQRR
jgi:hypothetical protein